ncbi:MAG: DUF1127 domain-containing protein [Rhodobacterales bacterium]|nr:DUF1127 domain-containing protein [Rhodobacterales bacterium]
MLARTLAFPRRLVFRPFAALAAALEAHRSRKALARLDPRLLRDIGLTREEALDEAARPIWDAPLHWRR